jgi:hypothetical protein
MIDTTIEIRSTDSEWLIKSLEYMLFDLKEQQKEGFEWSKQSTNDFLLIQNKIE